jgi:hypothetical protein
MNIKGFDKFYWGFLFIMFDFKISGFDILPDVIGYLFLAAGFAALAQSSIHFKNGGHCNIPMIFLSLLSIYEPPAVSQGQVINFGPFGLLGIPIAIASIVFGLMTIYYLFMGIKDMAVRKERQDIFEEADRNWRQYLFLQLAVILVMVLVIIPPLAIAAVVVLLIISIVVMLEIMRFMRKCGEYL